MFKYLMSILIDLLKIQNLSVRLELDSYATLNRCQNINMIISIDSFCFVLYNIIGEPMLDDDDGIRRYFFN